MAAIPVNRGSSGKKPNVCLIEIGGTVGDMESMLFLEAIRQVHKHQPTHPKHKCLSHTAS